MAQKAFMCYFSYLELLSELTDEECGRLFRALLTYGDTGEIVPLSGNERFIFPAIRGQIDRDSVKYIDKCSKNRDSILKRWHTNEYERIQTNTNYTNIKENSNENENKKKKTISISNEKLGEDFFPPSVCDVQEFCSSSGLSLDAVAFVSYYSSNGWQAAGKPIRDWRAVARRWAQDGGQSSTKHGTESLSPDELAYIMAGVQKC